MSSVTQAITYVLEPCAQPPSSPNRSDSWTRAGKVGSASTLARQLPTGANTSSATPCGSGGRGAGSPRPPVKGFFVAPKRCESDQSAQIATPTAIAAIRKMIEALVALPTLPHSTNFYADDHACCTDVRLDYESANTRRERMATHLECAWGAPLLLIGEAAGWRGARQTGVPFTAPFDLHGSGMREPSATIVRQTIANSGMPGRVMTWNAYPLHPHQVGLAASNRSPTAREVASGLPLLDQLVRGRRIIAVGRRAADSLAQIFDAPPPIASAAKVSSMAVQVRHPSFGGARAFREQFAMALVHFGFTKQSGAPIDHP
ncbi:Uracil DNA glycosylase superfamily protein [Blastococcus aurantiacus]|uniref:Uracil DNA glycosylase superfamily protein n=1 Tax=Blastococcus aurantiacus TaxID=1550231 RepID=A0A1G7J409_9ACTN|nr:Uracil DNA glycosylase superfamily protein [Blastococcus aurantiacus]